MIQTTRTLTTEALGRWCQQFAFMATILICAAAGLSTQAIAVECPLLDSPGGDPTERHIFYVHGMGIEPRDHDTQDFQVSLNFRKTLCKQMGCTPMPGEQPDRTWVDRKYADLHHFDPKTPPPSLLYLNDPIWNAEDWLAAAPFVDTYKLTLKDHTTIYLHEINWWPLVLSAKCRQIVAPEAALVNLDKDHAATCSATIPAGTYYRSHNWLSGQTITPRPRHWPQPALFNRTLKHDILDWGFADALLAVGPLHDYLVEGIRELIDSVTLRNNQETVIVSHSLGSYLIFSALDLQNNRQNPTFSAQGAPTQTDIGKWKIKFGTVLSQTSGAFFLANQVRLLELASLNTALTDHLDYWNDCRGPGKQPKVVAFSDTGDLLTWLFPEIHNRVDGKTIDPKIDNEPAKNAWRWFGLIESPTKAHVKYDQNKKVVRAVVRELNGQ